MATNDLEWWLGKREVPWNPKPLSRKNFPPIIVGALVESMLYGIHLILFLICISLLLSKRLRLHYLMLSGITAMMVLATADIALTWRFLLFTSSMDPLDIIRGTTLTFLKKLFPKFMIYVANNLVAVSLLIARCYVVWGQQTYMAIGFIIPLLICTGFGFASQISRPLLMQRFVPIFLLVTLVLNNVLTILTGSTEMLTGDNWAIVAGRIWWLSRRVGTAFGRRTRSQYRTTSALIVESGLLYSMALLILIGLAKTRWVVLAGAVVLRIVSIMPIMIFVQIALGHATNPNKSTERTTGIHGTRPETVILDTIVASGGGVDNNSSSMQLTTHASSIDGA
ncbi:hypothetical protein D9611_009177 [Ephemerocybe angulata]|uniref:Uncharacterized protein n=1 Tax=Ephemerocybe angulata TaxID=980116 RepID=A0A8H5FJT2_9AGAR|nr:hypothetical protein D9611_009177 [Tulosesus angulatus]